MGYGILRIEGYKAKASNIYNKDGSVAKKITDTAEGILAECLRELENYKNPNYDNSIKNISLIKPVCAAKDYLDTLKRYRKANNIKGNLKLNSDNHKMLSTILCEAIVTASPDWMAEKSIEEQIQFLKDGFEFLKIKFPTVQWIAAEIHCDEPLKYNEDTKKYYGGMHLQACFLPVYIDDTGKKTISWGNIQGGYNPNYMTELQDEWYQYTISKGYDLERGKDSKETKAKHMRPKEYKEYQETLKKQKEKLEIIEKRLDNIEPNFEALDKVENINLHKNITGKYTITKEDCNTITESIKTVTLMSAAYDNICDENEQLKKELKEKNDIINLQAERNFQLNEELSSYKRLYKSLKKYLEEVLKHPFKLFQEWHNKKIDKKIER